MHLSYLAKESGKRRRMHEPDRSSRLGSVDTARGATASRRSSARRYRGRQTCYPQSKSRTSRSSLRRCPGKRSISSRPEYRGRDTCGHADAHGRVARRFKGGSFDVLFVSLKTTWLQKPHFIITRGVSRSSLAVMEVCCRDKQYQQHVPISKRVMAIE